MTRCPQPNPKIWLNLYELHNQNLQKNCQLIVEVYDSAAALQVATLFFLTNCTLVTSSDVASALKPPKVKASRRSRQRESQRAKKGARMKETNMLRAFYKKP